MRSVRRKLGVAAGAALAITLIGATLALGVTKTIDDSGLLASGRAWDFFNSDDAGVLTGFSPVDDGVMVAQGRSADDGFDGGLIVGVDGAGFTDGDGKGKFNPDTNTFKVGRNLTGTTLRVGRTETAKGPYLRSLIELRNPTMSAFTGKITWDSDMGSDGDESTQASATGDKTFTKADRWVVSSETGANAFGDDPTLTFVLFGKGAAQKVDTVVEGPGETENLTVDYKSVKVPAGSSRYLLFYTEMNANPSKAKDSVRKYNDRHLSRSLLKGISQKTRNKIVNWDLG